MPPRIPIPIPIPQLTRLWDLTYHNEQPAVTGSCLLVHYCQALSPQIRPSRGEGQVATGWTSMRKSKRDVGGGMMKGDGDGVGRSFLSLLTPHSPTWIFAGAVVLFVLTLFSLF